MSIEAVSAVLAMSVDRSTAKFVLVAMANLADQNMVCWPSMGYLCKATCQDRKTVLANIKRLKEAGLISDTDQRKGQTGQVVVYRLHLSENGSAKASPKWNRTESGTVPKLGVKPTAFPLQQSQKRDTEPLRTQKEPSIGTTDVGHTSQLPDWIPLEAWNGFVEMRKAEKASMTGRAMTLQIGKLEKFRALGHDIEAILDQSTSNNWKDLYPVKVLQQSVMAPKPWADAK